MHASTWYTFRLVISRSSISCSALGANVIGCIWRVVSNTILTLLANCNSPGVIHELYVRENVCLGLQTYLHQSPLVLCVMRET